MYLNTNDKMTRRSKVLYKKGKYDRAFKGYAMSLIDRKNKEYYDKHLMIDTILDGHVLSDNVCDWLISRKESSEVLILQAKMYSSRDMRDKAIECLNKANVPMAIYLLGNIYYETDVNKAMILFDTSAKQGNRNAQYTLGLIYEKKSDFRMKDYYRLCAEQDHPLAMYKYAHIYEKDGDVKEAISYFKKCEHLDNNDARCWLIDYYMKINDRESMATYCDKIENLDIKWCETLKMFYIERFDTSSSHCEKTAIKKKLLRVCTYLIKKEDPEAMYYIVLFDNGYPRTFITDNGTYTAKEMLQRSADLGYLKSQYLYGHRYDDYEYHLMAATRDYVPALYDLSNCLVNRDEVKVAIYYLKRGLDLIYESNISKYVLHGLTDYKLMIRNLLSTIYRKNSLKIDDIDSLIKYYAKHELGGIINTILYSEDEYFKIVCQSVYMMETLEDTPIYCLAFVEDLKKIKLFIEEDINITLQNKDMLKFVNLHFKYKKELNINMIETLNNTSLFVKVLHDIIEKYL
jgi:TPR repeat protein